MRIHNGRTKYHSIADLGESHLNKIWSSVKGIYQIRKWYRIPGHKAKLKTPIVD